MSLLNSVNISVFCNNGKRSIKHSLSCKLSTGWRWSGWRCWKLKLYPGEDIRLSVKVGLVMRDTDSHSVNHHHQNSLQLLPNDNSLQYCWVIVVSWSFYCLIKSESLLDSLITWNSLQSGCHHQELTAHHVRFLRIKLTENIQKD